MCEIDDTEIDTFINKRLLNAKKGKQAIVLVGGPGSGKSSGKPVVVSILNKKIEDFANIETDEIISIEDDANIETDEIISIEDDANIETDEIIRIKDFANIETDEIISKLFNNDETCREKVNEINNKSFEMAIEQNKNIIFDRTGSDFDWYSTNVLKKLKDKGYKVFLVIIMNNIETALKRIQTRANIKGRNVNQAYAENVYKILSSAVPKYLSLDCEYADSIYLYDNSKENENIRLIYITTCDDSEKKITMSGVKIQSRRKYRRNKKSLRKSRRNKKSLRKYRLNKKSLRKYRKK